MRHRRRHRAVTTVEVVPLPARSTARVSVSGIFHLMPTAFFAQWLAGVCDHDSAASAQRLIICALRRQPQFSARLQWHPYFHNPRHQRELLDLTKWVLSMDEPYLSFSSVPTHPPNPIMTETILRFLFERVLVEQWDQSRHSSDATELVGIVSFTGCHPPGITAACNSPLTQ